MLLVAGLDGVTVVSCSRAVPRASGGDDERINGIDVEDGAVNAAMLVYQQGFFHKARV